MLTALIIGAVCIFWIGLVFGVLLGLNAAEKDSRKPRSLHAHGYALDFKR